MTSIFYSDAIKHCSLENHSIHTPHHKKDEWRLRNADSDSSLLDTPGRDVDNSASTSFISAHKPKESADATSNGNNTSASPSLGLKEMESIAKALSSLQSAQSSSKHLSTHSSSKVLSSFLPPDLRRSTTDRIKKFVRRETSHLELNHRLREVELESYREDLVFKRRLLLFLAYAMASVFTALSLWVVCFVLCETVIVLDQNLSGREMLF